MINLKILNLKISKRFQFFLNEFNFSIAIVTFIIFNKMVFIHIISILSFLGNLTISSKDILFHPNPNYFFTSSLLTKSNSLSISNSFFHKSFTFSFYLSKFTSFYLKKTIFNF